MEIQALRFFRLNYYDKKPFWETILVQMHKTLKHNSPDKAIIDLQPHVGVVHAFPSNNLKAVSSPMTRLFHGNLFPLFFDMENYNHRELLPELQAAGYRLPQRQTRKVHPAAKIPDSHPLATVRDSFNAVFVHGQACDDAMFMGRGAGQMPTASAVLGDVIDVMRNIIQFRMAGSVKPRRFSSSTVSRCFCRFSAASRSSRAALWQSHSAG